MTLKQDLEAVRDTLMDGSISHVAIRVSRALQQLDFIIATMSVDQYIDYLIDTAKQHASGNTSIAVQPVELATLKALIQSERKLQQTFSVNTNGNPA